MSAKKETKKLFSWKFWKELEHILKDIFFAYRNFIHWSVSRIIISLWSIVLAILVAFPIFLLWIIFGFIDGINWMDVVKYSINGEDPEHSQLLFSIASHPYALVTMLWIMLASVFAFLIASMYQVLLLSRLSLKYISKKKLEYKKNLYFSRKYITTFLALFCWNTVYILALAFIWISASLWLYVLFRANIISFTLLSYLGLWVFLIFLALLSYVSYRILFWYVILADTRKNHKLKPARSYLRKSIKITKNKGFVKFLIVSLLYAAFTLPFNMVGEYMQREVTSMKDTLAFKSGLIWNIDPKEVKYYEFLTAKYDHFSDDDIIEKIVFLSRMRVLYFFVSYLLFSGVFILIITSFYKRVLIKK